MDWGAYIQLVRKVHKQITTRLTAYNGRVVDTSTTSIQNVMYFWQSLHCYRIRLWGYANLHVMRDLYRKPPLMGECDLHTEIAKTL